MEQIACESDFSAVRDSFDASAASSSHCCGGALPRFPLFMQKGSRASSYFGKSTRETYECIIANRVRQGPSGYWRSRILCRDDLLFVVLVQEVRDHSAYADMVLTADPQVRAGTAHQVCAIVASTAVKAAGSPFPQSLHDRHPSRRDWGAYAECPVPRTRGTDICS